MSASKALAGLLRDSEEWREFFKTCSETSSLRLRLQARQHLDGRYGGGIVPDESGAQEIRAAVGELRRALNPEGERRIAAAREAVEEARGLKNHAYLRRRGASSVAGLFMGRKYGAAS